ncbi:MAG: hypothetical protein JRD89_06040 [Deltaproteobacteria bacterium]|nr:hypothetical protein [Deltaproteobacteria bacterium]
MRTIRFMELEDKTKQNGACQIARLINGLKELSHAEQERLDQQERIRVIDRQGYATCLRDLLGIKADEDAIIAGLSEDGLEVTFEDPSE